MSKEEAIRIYNDVCGNLPYNMISETERFFVFSYNDNDMVVDPIAVDKKTGMCCGYTPWLDRR